MYWIDELNLLAQADENWLDWQSELAKRTREYGQLLAQLTPSQQIFLEEYISVCQEAEYALVSIAYELGHRHGRNGTQTVPYTQTPNF